MAEKLNDKQLLIFGPFTLFVLVTLFFNLGTVLNEETPLPQFILFGVSTIYFTWIIGRAIVAYIQSKFGGIENSQKRILTLIIISFPAVCFLVGIRLILLKYWIYPEIEPFEWFGNDTLFMLGINLFQLTIIFSIYESRYFFQQWLQTKQQAEELLRANLEIQLDSLKSQVQPHFLFNSLNTLQALVRSAENKQAVHFIGDLSQVYRYLLQSSETHLIPLEKELAFSHAYFNLLKTRFGEGLKLEINVKPAYRQHLVPPVTLQLLIENAVKHNIASVTKPLIIEVCSIDPNMLTIRNNLQLKPKNTISSNSKGLLNITSKYRLLGYSDILITSGEDTFEVKIPLINAATRETTHH